MFRFEELEIWKLALEYAEEIYDLLDRLPISERYNVNEQLRRSALSISSNIAEGAGSSTTKNFASFLNISIASVFETVGILFFAEKRKYISEEKRIMLYKKAELLVKKTRSFKNSLKV